LTVHNLFFVMSRLEIKYAVKAERDPGWGQAQAVFLHIKVH